MQRDYLGFRKEWKGTVAPTHDKTFQLRQIRFSLPMQIQPNIKNLKLMKEVWEVLDEELGLVLENVSRLVKSLIAF